MTRLTLEVDRWNLIAPLFALAKPKRFHEHGRITVTHLAALTVIRRVLKMGISAEDLPLRSGCEWGMTCWRMPQACHAAGNALGPATTT